jgi:hypothetical protein
VPRKRWDPVIECRPCRKHVSHSVCCVALCSSVQVYGAIGQRQMAWPGVTEEVRSDRKVTKHNRQAIISDLKLVKIPYTCVYTGCILNAWTRCSLFWDVTERTLVGSYRWLVTTYWPHRQGSNSPSICDRWVVPKRR